jgi:hypothetical protein
LFVSGYLETVLLLVAGIVLCQWIRDMTRPPAEADPIAILRD